MPLSRTRLVRPGAQLEDAFAAIRAELEIPDGFPAEVEAAAADAVARMVLPDADATDIPFVTVDPLGSRDLDQAVHIAERRGGFVVHYAIADLAAVVTPGGVVDLEARRRGQTSYAPDGSVPLHPRSISEDGASLLPGVERGAYVWRFELDASGAVTDTALRRARIRSREQLTYAEAQRRIDAGDEGLTPLRSVGILRIEQEAARGGASLDLPEEEVVAAGESWAVQRRALLPVEQWNAQVSLMTGMAAARVQLDAGSGIIRTMPKPDQRDMDAFVDASTALGVPWLPDEAYGAYLRRLDRGAPATLAILTAARRLFRGAGYLVLDGTPHAADDVTQAAIGAPYAHTTAPLRRLVDRYVLAHAEAIIGGGAVPDWAVAGLDGLPRIMQSSGSRASTLDRECLAVVTAAVLAPRVGEVFHGVVLERRDRGALVELLDPPVEVNAAVDAPAGAEVAVRIAGADIATRSVTATAV